jgi:predicted alpha/beta hydrolase family esterase
MILSLYLQWIIQAQQGQAIIVPHPLRILTIMHSAQKAQKQLV